MFKKHKNVRLNRSKKEGVPLGKEEKEAFKKGGALQGVRSRRKKTQSHHEPSCIERNVL